MNIAGLILLGAGYLLGNPKARDEAFSSLQKLAGMGIDALNKRGDNNVPAATVIEPEQSN